MNGVFELICIFLAFIAVMIIFAALRSIQKDIDEIYGRVYNLCITAEMILTRVSKPEPYKEECTGDSCPISYKD